MKRLTMLLCMFFILPTQVLATCAGLPAIGNAALTNVTCTIAGVDGADKTVSENSSVNTAALQLNTGASITINSSGSLAAGSILFNGGSIAIASGGTILLGTPLYVPDADADGWVPTLSPTLLTATASGKRRLGLMRSLSVADCGDSNYSVANTCCVVATRYQDLDGDTYGNPNISISACTTTGYVDNNTDCYDGNANAYPGATTCSSTNRGDGSYDYNCTGGDTACGVQYYSATSYNLYSCGANHNCFQRSTVYTCINTPMTCGNSGYAAGGYGVSPGQCANTCEGWVFSCTVIGASGTQACR